MDASRTETFVREVGREPNLEAQVLPQPMLNPQRITVQRGPTCA